MSKKHNKYQILVAYHKPDVIFDAGCLLPIHVGRAITKFDKKDENAEALFKMVGDDTGDNISNKNSYYNEMTALYWAWKNQKDIGNPKYIGLMHYRRHFNLAKRNESKVIYDVDEILDPNAYIANDLKLTEDELDIIFSEYDVITTKPFYKESVLKHFEESHDIAQLEEVDRIIKDNYPKYYESFDRYIHGHNVYFCNMFIFPKAIFDEYCEFAFGVLDRYEHSATFKGERFYISERITGAFIQYLIDSGKKVLTVPTSYFESDVEINVAFATDRNFLKPTLVAIESMLTNAKKLTHYNIYIMTSSEDALYLRKETKYLNAKYSNYDLKVINMGKEFSDIEMSIKHISFQTYYRLLLPKLLADKDKCLYLDSDIVVEKDLSELFRNDIASHYVAGVRAAGYYYPDEWVTKHSTEIGIPSNDKYINAGVLLLNLKKIREDGIDKKMLELVERNFSSQDQDIINVACYDKIKILPLKYNCMTKYIKSENGKLVMNEKDINVFGAANVEEALTRPSIIHFADKIKPWNDPNVVLANRWYNYYYNYGNKRPLISVIIPIFNMEQYLGYCLDSIFNQTLKDIEVICINDGSSDNSINILKEYKAKHDNLVIIDQANHGVGYSRNVGIMCTRSEFLCFMDPDDFYPSNDVLETLYKTAKEKNVAIVGGSWMEYIEKPNGESFYKEDFSKTGNYGYTFLENKLMKYKDYQFDFGYHRFIYSVDLIRKHNLRFPLLTRYQDPVFFAKTMIAANQFYALKKHTYCYRYGYQVQTIYKGKKLEDYTLGVIDLLRISDRYNLDYLHMRNVEQLNRNANLYMERIKQPENVYLIDLLIRANSAVNRNMLKRLGWKINENYVIDPVRRLMDYFKSAISENRLIDNSVNNEEGEEKHFIIFRPFIYIYRYGFIVTLVRIFKGREVANRIKKRRVKKKK